MERAITQSRLGLAGRRRGRPTILSTWTQLVGLHRQQRSLNKELKEAELALGQEAELRTIIAWLRDVQGPAGALDGAEALIEGFGVSSGRPARTF